MLRWDVACIRDGSPARFAGADHDGNGAGVGRRRARSCFTWRDRDSPQVDTNTSLSVTSSDVGQYFLPNLPPGRYEVSAELKGFRIERRTDLVLQLGQELTIDFTLKVEGLQEVVVVGANAPILETTKNTVGTIITKDEIDDLPTWSVTSARSPGSRQASRRASEETATACP